jgi:hypothetical protein
MRAASRIITIGLAAPEAQYGLNERAIMLRRIFAHRRKQFFHLRAAIGGGEKSAAPCPHRHMARHDVAQTNFIKNFRLYSA